MHMKNVHPEKCAEWVASLEPPERAQPLPEKVEELVVEPKHLITRRLEFDAGHRVYQHESKCANIHGHRYAVEISCCAADLDGIGRVIDFSVIKKDVGSWIDTNLDHGMILYRDDPLVGVWKSFEDKAVDGVDTQKYYVMDTNPTAENISKMIFEKAGELLEPHSVSVVKVRLYETPNCYADYPVF